MKRKYSACANKMVKASNGKMTHDEADDILKNAKDAQEKLEAGGYSTSDAIQKSVSDYFKGKAYKQKKAKLDTIKNIKLETENFSYVDGLVNSGLSVNEAVFAFCSGINSLESGTRYSLDLKKDTIASGFMGKFDSKITAEGLMPFLQSEEFSEPIMRDLWELSFNRKPISNMPQVNRIAEIIFETQEAMRKRLNKAGAEINNMQGFIVSQTHDIDVMKRAGKQTWIDFVKNKIDLERSFGGGVDEANINEVLSSAYEALLTGVRLSVDTTEDTPNLYTPKAQKISQPRQIIFKKADDFIAYKNEFGRNTFNESLAESLRTNSHDIALLENLGTNPRAMLERIYRKLKEKHRDKLIQENPKNAKEKLNQLTRNDIWDVTVQSSINDVLGIRGDNRKFSDITNSIKNYNILTMLGRALFSQIPDLHFKASEYQHEGRSFLSSWGAVINDIRNSFKSDIDKRRFASMVGVYAESFLSDLNVKVSTGKTVHKKFNRLTQLFMKLNLQGPWDKANKTSMSRTLAHDLGLMSNMSFDELSKDTKRIFNSYGINSNDWDVIRVNKKTLEDGRDYVVADGIKDNKIAEKLTAYFIDRVNYATNAITGSTRARMAFGTTRGTPAGEMLQLTLQFKSFMFSMFEKSYGRDLYAKGEADKMAVVQTILMLTVLSYIGGAVKNILSNKTPKNPFDPKVFLEAMIRGGGLSIAGDLLFPNVQGGQNVDPLKYVAGPTFSRFKDIHDIYQNTITGRDAKAQAFRTAVGAIPFNNLFYVKEPLNEMMLYSIEEYLNPGFLNRMDKRDKERYNQQQLIDTR